MSVDVKYRTKASATGGREGQARTEDGSFQVSLSTPKELGGGGGSGNNPEQLFAAGYAACFHSALRLAARQAKIDLGETTITAQVTLSLDEGKFVLSTRLAARLPGLEQGRADQLVAQAHQICPYSNATRGNMEVRVTATV